MEQKTFDMAKDCMVCGKRIGFRGFCSTICHNNHYDSILIGESINKKVISMQPVKKWKIAKVENGTIVGIVPINYKYKKYNKKKI